MHFCQFTRHRINYKSLTIISSGINGCSIIARTVPFTRFLRILKTIQPCSKIYIQKRIISMVSCLMPRAFMCSIISLLFM